MATLNKTALDKGSVQIGGCEFKDEKINFPASLAFPITYAEGTVLARLADVVAVTASAVSGGGNGTVTAASVDVGPVVPLVGVYTLTCLLAVTNGGKWKLTDPNGEIVADDLEQTVGAGAATVFKVGGLVFTITDGGTDFSAGATATLTVAASGKMVAYDPNGAGGAQVPKAVVAKAITAAAAGDIATQVIIKGNLAKERLVTNLNGTVAAISGDATFDTLRSYGLIALSEAQLGRADN
jgi:hypothetical protein